MYALTLCYSFIQQMHVGHLLYSTHSTKFQGYSFYEMFSVIVCDETGHTTKQYVQEQ